jgi:hypothetical protein
MTNGKLRRGLAATAAVLVLAGGCSYERERERVRQAEGDPLRLDAELISSLQSFDECDDLLSYLRTEGAKVVGPYGFDGGWSGPGVIAMASRAVAESGQFSATADAGGGSAAPSAQSAPATTTPVAGIDYSSTNVQEEGVDEPDLVKTDGRRLVTIGRGELRIVDLTGDAPRLASSLTLGDAGWFEGQLLLHRDRVVVLRPEIGAPVPMPTPVPGRPMPVDPGIGGASVRGGWSPYPQGVPRTNVTVVDISELASPKVAETVVLDGSLVAARMVGGVARVVLRSGPAALPFLFPSGSQDSVDVATAANRELVAESTLDDWLPGFTVGDGAAQRMTDCRNVSRPEVFSGVGMLSVVTVDAADPRPGPAATIIGAGETVYASAEHLYVTSSVWSASAPCPPNADCAAAAGGTTDIHAFDIREAVRTTYLASGRVKGRLLNSFSMSEHDGHLRVATTDDVAQESAVVILRRQDGVLAEVGSVGGLGKTERIYAVRFLGDQGYVVTFRQTDPLYVLDLRDPASPTLEGELKIPGYSAYLHPIGDGRLLGVGQDATDDGRVQGTQISLFDVRDPADPRRVATATLPQSTSEAEYDHHAFLWWARTRLAVIPVQDYRSGTSGAVGFTVESDAVAQTGRITQRDVHPIRRSVVVGDRLLTLSDSGVQANDLRTLAERSWLAY